MNTAWNRRCRNLPSGTALSLYEDRITPIIGASLSEPHTSGTALRKCVNVRACLRPYKVKVPVRYRPNAASGGWGYGRDLVSAAKRG